MFSRRLISPRFSTRFSLAGALTGALLLSTLATFQAPPAVALAPHEKPSVKWGYLYAGGLANEFAPEQVRPREKFAVTRPTTITVKYTNFPEQAKVAFDAAVSIWAGLFSSNVPINIDATWSNLGSTVLGSARPGNYYNGFANAPDKDLYYPSALANAIAGKDLDPSSAEIIARFSSGTAWYYGTDGRPPFARYDLVTVVLHELCHGLGFLSSDTYDSYSGVGTLDRPTAFDAFTRTVDDKRLSDLSSPSIELGRALTNTLYWGGSLGIAANGGSKPKIYSPTRYDDGSSISHLDENAFPSGDKNSLMSPQLDAGEVIHDVGPVAAAMLDDLRTKPPAGAVTALPSPPRNISALVGDRSVLISFDPPVDARITQVSGYEITTMPGATLTKIESSPLTIPNLKVGTAYTFSIRAVNPLGSSVAATAGPVTPQLSWRSATIDPGADPSFAAATTWRNQTVFIYSDKRTGYLKRSTLINKKWVIETIDGDSATDGETTHNLDGALSTCVTGIPKSQILHVFYSDMVDKDLRHAAFDGKKWSYDIVDGNGPVVQAVEDPIRVRTKSDVNVSNACVATPAGLQVFYRDDSQGILLGALQTGSTWRYELVDGDRKTDGRSTGDVGFHLAATNVGKNVHLIYDSVIIIDRARKATEGDVRHAYRASANPVDWKFDTVDAADARFPVSGYGVAIGAVGTRVYGAWLAASTKGASTPIPDTLFYKELSATDASVITTTGLGSPTLPLAIDGSSVAFGCQGRLCVASLATGKGKLISGLDTSQSMGATWTKVSSKLGLLVGSPLGLLWLAA
ncbi:MAG: fibronectin [Actinomycetes bacterium]